MSPEPALSSHQKQLIRETLESLREYSHSLTKLFYGRLFELAPEVRGLFSGTLDEQARKLLDMLVTIVEALDHFDELRAPLGELGRGHAGYGVQPEHYELLRGALLWALAQALEQEFDRETKIAWDHMLRAVSAAMLEGATSPVLEPL
jgi:nitric oxide dioxygenase